LNAKGRGCTKPFFRSWNKRNLGPSSEDLNHIYIEELEHFKLLQKAIANLGGDATVQTPSADVVGVLSHGIVQVVSDPRTTIPQTLQAVLSANWPITMDGKC
jgi:Mn-containing catalase